MSSRRTYILACDGGSCPNRFVLEQSAPPTVGEVRRRAADSGWTYRDDGTAMTRRLDFCPLCRAAAKKVG